MQAAIKTQSGVAVGATPNSSQTRPTPALRTAGKIEVSGSVPLGTAMRCVQLPSPNGGSGGNGEWIGKRIEYALVPDSSRDRRIDIEGQGLVTGYGIFGAPGCGKTHFVLQVLENLLLLNKTDPESKFGGLILDPKGSLLGDITDMWKRLGKERQKDLIILKPELLNEPQRLADYGIDPAEHVNAVNLIDCALNPGELGRMLVLAAQSAGVSAKEPFWFLAWTNLFAAVLTLLEYRFRKAPTLRELIDSILLPGIRKTTSDVRQKNGARTSRQRRGIEEIAEELTKDLKASASKLHRQLPSLPEQQIRSDIEAAAAQVASFFETDYVRTLEAFISNAFGAFQQYRFRCLSPTTDRRPLIKKYGAGRSKPSFYDRILEEGKVVFVSAGPADPGMGKMLCTLVKTLFQQAVMSRKERYLSFQLENFKRPVFLACDEYAEIASEVPGQPVGDGRFFSLARENGCMGVLATQSIHTLENSSLQESWKSIFSNLGAKIFMGAADNETAKQASDLAGTVDWEMNSMSVNHSKERGFSEQNRVEQRPELPSYILSHVLRKGQAVIIGSLDGRKSPPVLRFLQVPEKAEQTRMLGKDTAVPMVSARRS